VKRAKKIISKAQFDTKFSGHHSDYDYDDFLKAMALYPKFCGESSLSMYNSDLTKTCKRELATLFAHFDQEAGKLKAKIEYNCDSSKAGN